MLNQLKLTWYSRIYNLSNTASSICLLNIDFSTNALEREELVHFDIGSVTLDYNKRHHHERRSQSLKKEKEKFDTPRFFQRVKISTLRSVWSCKKGQSCSHMCVIWKCLGCWLSCTTITTWNFKEGEKLLWFFGQQKKAELALAGRAKKHEHGNHPTKVQSQQRHYNEVDSTISLDSTLKTVDQWSKLSNQGVPNGIMAGLKLQLYPFL